MQKRLNFDNANQAIEAKGLTQTAIANTLGVSKEAVSQWLNAKSFPRPNKLLQLSKLLALEFNQLVIKDDPSAPIIAFRKMKGTKTKDHHVEKAQEMGNFLRNLVPYIPFDTLEMPPVLKSPTCEYNYISKVTSKVRHDISLSGTEPVDFGHLIKRFYELQAVIVPVLWGSKKRHENAVHIYLPDSQTTWVYLNLDTNVHDFKFWMAHELGHCLSPSLSGEEAEDFADTFAGALLFPHECAEEAYRLISRKKSISAQISEIIEIAKKFIISPNTVKSQVEQFAKYSGQSQINLGRGFYGAVTNFNKSYLNLSDALFDNDASLDARDFVSVAEREFETPFFDLLRNYLKENAKGPGIISSIMDIPLLDARSILEELT